jgi:pimeloyl-ACP methyl ester carboxylesterase
VVTVLVLGACLLAPGRAHAAIPFAACHGSSGVLCGAVTVPLDYSGVTPGQISLAVEKLPVSGIARGTVFLIAGGPGQASAIAFNLARDGKVLQQFFPGYDLVAFDDRGTGNSGPLSCPELAGLATANAQQSAQIVGACGDQLGAMRLFYGTHDHAEDIEAVRQALGVDKIAVLGVSYGTKLAVAYALAHPDHVERLLLDSVVVPEGPDVFATDTLRAIPNGLASICFGGACRTITRDPGGEVAKLANRLEAHPIAGRVIEPGGRTVRVQLDGILLLELVVDADLNPGVTAELPAAVHAALAGRPLALLRLFWLDAGSSVVGGSDFDPAIFAATTCDDGNFPWSPSTPVDQRQGPLDAARAALPPGATGLFGLWATQFGTADMCKLWPSPSGGEALAPGPLPNVPVLILSGDRDMRTPTPGALQVAARFPQAHVLVVPGVGHSVLTADLSQCSSQAVLKWLDGAEPPATCARSPLLVPPIPPFAASVSSFSPIGRVPGLQGRTLAAVAWTLREASATWLLAGGATAGLDGGTLQPQGSLRVGFLLHRYSSVPGVEVSGTLDLDERTPEFPVKFNGLIKITGSKAANGTLNLRGGTLSGTLAGRKVSAKT